MPRPRRAGWKPPQKKKPKQNSCMNGQIQLDKWLVSSNDPASPGVEEPVELGVEYENEDGTVLLEKHQVQKDSVLEAQELIQLAVDGDKERLYEAINQAIQKLYTYPAREGQLEALRHLVYLRKDLILIAKTSFGKSMILQAVSLLLAKSITLVILPLDQIGVEQTGYIQKIGGRPCFLNAETISSKLLEEIKAGKVTHILLSPELAISERFHSTVTHPGFRDRLALVVVDECHLVSQWGKAFRTEYARLHLLRSLLPRNVPWFACSATLDEKTLGAVIKGLGFAEDVEVLRKSINRPELLIQTALIPKNAHKKASALRFLFDSDPGQPVLHPSQIPKTLVFFDSKKDAYTATDGCRYWLQHNQQPEYGEANRRSYTPQQALDTVKVFHSCTAQIDKEAMIEELRKPGSESKLRVLMTTEALALGVDLQDIETVVIYRLPKNLQPATLWQRGGRACRSGQKGRIVILADKWVYGDRHQQPIRRRHDAMENELGEEVALADSDGEIEEEADTETLPKRGHLTDKDRRTNLPEFWYNLFNKPGCIRKQFLNFFQEPDEYRDEKASDRCCSNCNAVHQLVDPTRYLYNQLGRKATAADQFITDRLKNWAQDHCAEAFPHGDFEPDGSSILTQDQCLQLARYIQEASLSHLQAQVCDLERILGKWPWSNQFADELLAVLKEAQSAASNGPKETPAKRKRAPDDSSQVSQYSTPALTSASTPESQWQLTPSQTIPGVSQFRSWTPSTTQGFSRIDDWTLSQENPIPSQAKCMEPPSATPARKRQALGQISGNQQRKVGGNKN